MPGNDPFNIFGGRGPFGGGNPAASGGILNQGLSGGNTPQQHGYGISDQGQFQPYQTPMPAPHGYGNQFNLSGPGAGEQQWAQSQGKFNQPTHAEQYWNQLQGQGPGLDPYYQHASQRLGGEMANQLAARGQYGSSAGMRQTGDALASLAAEQANREAQYGLQKGQLAMGVDQDMLSRMAGGMQGANLAQQLQEQRIGDLYGRQLGLADRLSGLYTGQMNQLIPEDQAAMEAAMMAESGLAQQALEQGYRGEERNRQSMKDALSIAALAGGGA